MKTLFLVVITLLLQLRFAAQQDIALFDGKLESGVQEMFFKSKSSNWFNGHYYVVGATLDSTGKHNVLLQKVNASHQVVWSREFGGTFGGEDFGADVAFTTSGDIE